MARGKGSHSFTCTPTRSSAIGMSHIPAFAFPATAGTHLPTQEGLKAELAGSDHHQCVVVAVCSL